MQGEIAMQGLFTTPQNDRIATFDAQGRGVDGDIRTGFIDEKHDSQRHTDSSDQQSIRADVGVDHLANRLGQGGDIGQGRRNCL